MFPKLTDDDLAHWHEALESVEPMPGRRRPAAKPRPEVTRELAEPPKPRRRHEVAHRLDPRERDRLVAGKVPIEATLDLHWLTQGEAHARLVSFLHESHAAGRSAVLVITGKGDGRGERAEGILRRAVPLWIRQPPLSSMVLACEEASRRHGGEGALYVRLRRRAGSARVR